MIPVATSTSPPTPYSSGANTFSVHNAVNSPATLQPARNFQPTTFQAPRNLNADSTQFNAAGRTQSANNPFATNHTSGINKLQNAQPKFGFFLGGLELPAIICALFGCCCCALPLLPLLAIFAF